MTRPLQFGLAAALLAAAGLAASPGQSVQFMAVDDVRPGMVGIGRTVFAGEQLEEFKANILGVLKNVIGTGHDLILAKLEGGPLATTGVIQGMSGSPVYIDGKLVGAVSYALGSFPREPFAGITPIAEMTGVVDSTAPRTAAGLDLEWPATPAAVFSALRRVAERVAAPLRPARDLDVRGPASLADLAPALRPIGAAMVLGGFDPDLDRELRQALSASASGTQGAGRAARPDAPASLRPGDPVGVSLIRGDLEMGATGTVTHVDGSRVYAFGHPFLNLGPTRYPMTSAHVYGVLPSLDSSLKIATLGAVIGFISQDRASAIGGTLGPGPAVLDVNISLASERAAERRFHFQVLQDPLLTPLFAYVAVLNTLGAYERQAGALSVSMTGSVSFGADGRVAIDDLVTGDTSITQAAAAATMAVGVAAQNEFRAVTPDKLDLQLRVAERQASTTIERVWLDTTRPTFGSTPMLQVLLRDYRGGTETVSLPIAMPAQASGPLTLLVSDAATLTSLEQRDLTPVKPATFAELLARLNTSKRGNRLYVRLLTATPGTVVAGETLPALPASVQSVLDADKSAASTALSKTIVGAWERRMDRAVRGSRELTITLWPSAAGG